MKKYSWCTCVAVTNDTKKYVKDKAKLEKKPIYVILGGMIEEQAYKERLAKRWAKEL